MNSSTDGMRHNFRGTDPQAYEDQLTGWRGETVQALRRAIRAAGEIEERIKWGHIVGFHHGPVCLVRAEDRRVLFGLWRGRRLRELDPRLRASGKYELANITLTETDSVDVAAFTRLTKAAMSLNRQLGDPTARLKV